MAKYRKAILKALIDLDGKATNRQIYEQVKKYIIVEGQTPNNTIRRELQELRSRGYLTKKDNVDGVWEIRDFIGELKQCHEDINEKELVIVKVTNENLALKLLLAIPKVFIKLAIELMEKTKSLDMEDRKKTRTALDWIKSTLNISVPDEFQNKIMQFPIDNVKSVDYKYYNVFLNGSNPIVNQQ